MISISDVEIVHAWDAFTARTGQTGLVYTKTVIFDKGELHEIWHESDVPQYLRLGGYGISVPQDEKPEIKTGAEVMSVQSARAWSVMRIMDGSAGGITCETLLPRPGFRHCHLFGGTAAWPVWTSGKPVAPGKKISIVTDSCAADAEPCPLHP